MTVKGARQSSIRWQSVVLLVIVRHGFQTRACRMKTNKSKYLKRHIRLDALSYVSVVGSCGRLKAHDTLVHGVCMLNGIRL